MRQALTKWMVRIFAVNFGLVVLFSLMYVAEGLSRVTIERTASAMQVDQSNPIVGLEGRTSLLQRLSLALKANASFFGSHARPGFIVGTRLSLLHDCSKFPRQPRLP